MAAPPIDASVAEKTLPFVPARTPATAPMTVAAAPPLTMRFQVAPVGGDDLRVLDDDPTVERPISMPRLLANLVATFVLVLLAGLAVIASTPRLLGYRPVVVTSGSMEPAIHRADVVVTKPSDGADLRDGTVIDFVVGDDSVLHRITEVTPEGYRTAGDANRSADSTPVLPAQIRGIGVVVVPFIGLPAIWAGDGRWLHLVGLAALLVVCMYVARSRFLDPDAGLVFR